MTLTVSLPLPNKELRPNRRSWNIHAKAAATLKARNLARTAAAAALATAPYPYKPTDTPHGSYHVCWYYYGPTPDVDNCLASCKAYIDGCSEALRINDRSFDRASVSRVHDKNRRVEITFSIDCKK